MADDKDTTKETPETHEQEYDVDSSGTSMLSDSLEGFEEEVPTEDTEPDSTETTETQSDEPDSEPAESVDARETVQEKASAFEESHFRIGRTLGLDKDGVERTFKTPEAMEFWLANSASQQRQQDEKAPEPEQEPEIPKYELKLENEDDLAPEIVSTIKGMADHFNKTIETVIKENRSLKAELKQSAASSQEVQAQAVIQQFDQKIASLGTEWEPLFGKGETMRLSGEARRNRDKLAETAGALRQAYASLPNPRHLTLDEAVSLALRSEFDKPVTKQEPSPEQIETAKKRNGALTERNQKQRRQPAPSGLKAAADYIEAFRQEQGMMGDDDEY